MIDFEPHRRRELSLQDLADPLTTDDLGGLTREMCAAQLSLIEDAEDRDFVFVPKTLRPTIPSRRDRSM